MIANRGITKPPEYMLDVVALAIGNLREHGWKDFAWRGSVTLDYRLELPPGYAVLRGCSRCKSSFLTCPCSSMTLESFLMTGDVP